jgi:hypothetical protein
MIKKTVTATLAHPLRKYAGIIDTTSHKTRTTTSNQFFLISVSALRIVMLIRAVNPICVLAAM